MLGTARSWGWENHQTWEGLLSLAALFPEGPPAVPFFPKTPSHPGAVPTLL